MDKKITVIIPVFNGEECIHTTINSIINQTFGFENIELIIVDDCSTDNTPNIIKEFSQNYQNIKCIFLEKNYGAPGKARNRGIENATSDYIMFLDSDDEFAEDMCEVLYSTITTENVDFVSCRYSLYDNNKYMGHDKSFFSEDTSKIKFESVRDNIELISTCTNLVVWNKIYNKSFILKNNITFLDDEFCEDLIFEYEIFLSSENFILLNDYFGYKYQIPDSNPHEIPYKRIKDGFTSLNKLKIVFEKYNFKHFEVVNEFIVIWTRLILCSNLSYNDKKLFFNNMKKYYKEYSLFYRLINGFSLPINIIINIIIKLFSISSTFSILISKIYCLMLRY